MKSVYKLIKEYPDSPKLGAEACYISNNNWYGIPGQQIFAPEVIENNPEFWEKVVEDKNPLKLEVGKSYILIDKVVEKDYEILSYYGGKPGHSIYKLTNCKQGFTPYHKYLDIIHDRFTTSYMVNSNDWFIHSVKRLSDGEIFTIGDRIHKTIKNLTISHIILDLNTIYFHVNSNSGRISIKNAMRYKKPLFTTFDNVDIYNGDTYYWASEDLDDILINTSACSMCGKLPRKFFSTEQAAKEYINSKKVLFTTEDGVDIFEGDKFYYPTGDYSTVYKETAPIKSKIAEKSYNNLLKYCLIVSNHKFSTKEAAEEYILMNKPCLSMYDLKSTGCLSEKQWFAILDLVKYKSKL